MLLYEPGLTYKCYRSYDAIRFVSQSKDKPKLFDNSDEDEKESNGLTITKTKIELEEEQEEKTRR